MREKVLISGGTGMIGQKVIESLRNASYEVALLTRYPHPDNPSEYKWDLDSMYIDPECINGVTHIIHLAGAGIADKKWTKKRKKILLESRTKTALLLFELLKSSPNKVKAFISASAIGYYGDRGNEECVETDGPGPGFLSEVCVEWEKAANQFNTLGLRVVKLRIGIVLSKNGGMIPELLKPMSFQIAPHFGTGQQYYSWIHIDDVAGMFTKAVTDPKIAGVYNATSPEPVTNKTLVEKISTAFNRGIIKASVPAFILRWMLGDMSTALLMSTRAKPDKIMRAGYTPHFIQLEEALKDLKKK